ncbi:vitamin D 25-hydroxylase-like isoform X2 [Liolophura sinensis]|uniref:vitamin D 25-hydroxylase-like isoform X2 n=1 Tax=Liolophura sinensis TaxID=3198878 RepID=UPI003158851E
MLTMFWAIFLLTLTLYVVYRFLTFGAKYSQPPGPLRWPFVGHAFTVNTSQARVFAQLAKDFRGLYTLNFFGKRFVVISDARVIQNVKTSKEITEKLFTHSPCDFLSKFTLLGRTTPYMEPSEKWMSRRQVLTKKLNIYTGGLQLSESLLKQEFGQLTAWIESHKGNSVDLSPVLMASLVNTMTILLLGKRFPYEGPEIKAVCDVILGAESLSGPRTDGLLQALPCLGRLPVLWGATTKRLKKNLKLVQEYYYEVPKHDSKAGGTAGLMGLLMKTTEGNNNTGVASEFSEDNVMEMVIEVLTTSVPKMHAALMSFIWMTLHKPAIALKIQREVEKVTNSTRLPTLRDRERMPYTEAVILELLRFSPNVPFSRHLVIEDTKLEEFQIPSKTTILTDLSSVNHDANLWGNPDKFVPERFLDDNGRLLSEHSEPRKKRT